MRVRLNNQGISVRAIAGTHVVLLGMNATKEATKGLLGFAIQREDLETQSKVWLQSPRRFKKSPSEGRWDSHTDPIQEFMWSDYEAVPGTEYSYEVFPMYGEPANLKSGESVTVAVTTENDSDAKHAVIFNRGVAGSQAYSRKFGEHSKWYEVDKYGKTYWKEYTKPDEVPDNEAWSWLSRGLEEAMLEFIGRARGAKWAIRASVYEFDYIPAIQAFVDALESGADVKIIYDAKERSSMQPVSDTLSALKQIGLTKKSDIKRFEAMTVPRRRTPTISHNKFIVLLQDGKPIEVWTGSTNFTAGGIFGQSNVGHIIRDPEVAAKYLMYWEKVSTDPIRKTLQEWTVEQQPDLGGLPPANSLTPIFSRRLTNDMLEWYKFLLLP